MRPQAPATVIAAMDEEELKLFTATTQISRRLVYLSIIVPAIFFLLDIGFDVALVTAYWRNEQKWEAIVTVLVLVFAGVVTSVYYYFNEKWIDTFDTEDLRLGNQQEAQVQPSSSQDYPERSGDNEFHDLHPKCSEDLDAQRNSNKPSNSEPRASTSQNQAFQPEQKVTMTANSNQGTVIVTSSDVNKRKVWRLIRQLSRYTLLSPIFRAYYLVTKLGSSIEAVEDTRLKRRQPSERELDAIVTISESQINQACFNMIETNFEALPQTLLQIYLAVHLKLTFEFDNWADVVIYLTVAWSIFSAAYSATSYSAAYYLHSKIVRVKDVLYIGGEHGLKRLLPVSWFTLIATFFFNLAIIVGRIYGLANILVARGVWALLIFVIILYIIQFIWLETCPDQRVFYENPTRGIMTPCSNLVDRWKNIFCFHQILPGLKSIFVYHGIFLFIFLTFHKISEGIFGRHAQFLPQVPNKNQTSHYDFDNLSTNVGNLNKSSNSYFYAQIKTCDFNVFPKTCNLSHVILNEYGVLIYWAISLLISLIYLRIRTTRDKILLEKYFPMLKGIDMWTQLTDGEDLRSASIERKQILCLCIMANDQDLKTILRDKFPCLYYARKQEVAKTLNGKLLEVWKFYTQVYKYDWSVEIKNEAPRQTLKAHWERLKSHKGENLSAFGVYNNYVQKLSEMIDPLFDDQTVSICDLQFFMHFYDSFELYLSRSNSFRLGKIYIPLGLPNINKNKLVVHFGCACP